MTIQSRQSISQLYLQSPSQFPCARVVVWLVSPADLQHANKRERLFSLSFAGVLLNRVFVWLEVRHRKWKMPFGSGERKAREGKVCDERLSGFGSWGFILVFRFLDMRGRSWKSAG
jgi:hypothetical protein